MTVKELMTSSVCYVKSEAPISDVINLIKQYDIGIVPVCDNKGCLQGIITDRDIVLRCLSLGLRDFSKIKATEIMTDVIFSVSPEISIHDAASVFAKRKVRRLPVVENQRLVGVLSLSDLAKRRIFLAEVGDIMGELAKK